MKKVLVVIFVTLALTGCHRHSEPGSTGAAKLDIEIGGRRLSLTVKSAGVYYGNISSTSPGRSNIQTFNHDIVIANYDLDTTNIATMRKALTAPDQLRVELELTGEDGTKTDTPLKVGTYRVKAEKTNSVRFIAIATFAAGKETRTSFDTMSSNKKTTGEVKITSVTADTASGEINLTDGDKSIKGMFTAKLPKK